MNEAEYDVMFAQEADHWWYRGMRGLLRLAMERVPSEGGLRILDAGCGTGANAVMLQDYGRVTCFDFASLALAKCGERGLDMAVRGSVTALPFGDGAFDCVVSMDVLAHRSVSDPAGALVEVWRALRPGGHLVMNLPAYQWLRSDHDAAVHTDKRYTRGSAGALLRETGFSVELMTYWNAFLFPAIALRRKFGGGSGASDTGVRYSGFVEGVFGAGLAVERCLIRRVGLPFGVSVFAVARKVG